MAGLPEAVVHRTPRIQRNRGGTAARRKLHRYKVSVRQRTTHPPRRWGETTKTPRASAGKERPRDVFVGDG
ncbi:hypothetical protein CSB90_2961 [Pseudomonas aeruginosa]|nr:hypothetical protein CSB90_2961 [Pseudomonas aeruginosa]